MKQDSTTQMNDLMLKVLLVCGSLAGPLFTIVWLVTGVTRADYDPLRHPISSLAIGEVGWTQASNFLVTGLLTLAFAFGLRHRFRSNGGSIWGPRLIGIIAIGFLGAGIFVTDPMNGYPPGTPNLPLQWSLMGRLHRLFRHWSSWVCPLLVLSLPSSLPNGNCAGGRTIQGSQGWRLWSCSW